MAGLTPEPLAARLARKRALARAALWFEQLWPAVWPALGALGTYLCLALLDVPASLAPWPRLALLLLFGLAAAILLWRGLRGVRRPDASMADRRLEQATGLRHRPLATLADRLGTAGAESEAVWQVHLARLAAQIPRLRAGSPRPGLAARDRWALRGGLLVALVGCFVIAGPDAAPRIARALMPGLPIGPAAPGTEVQAWVTPPAYTGLPPVLLNAETPELGVPAGSRLTVSVTGTAGEPRLAVNGASEKLDKLDPTSWQAERDLPPGLGATAKITVGARGGTVASWTLTLIPDQPPVIAFTDPPGPAASGGRPSLQTRMAWQASDDYGVMAVEGELRLRDRPSAPALGVPAQHAGSPKTAHGAIVQDLTAHPWAGLAVLGRMVARDGAGQTGTSAAAGFVLPERPFQNPVARTIIAVRRQLSLTPEERRQARMVLDGLADSPETFDNATGILLNLRAISGLLAHGHDPGTVDEAQARMWQLALALEEGAADRTARALAEARQALRDTVDPNRETPAEQAEVDRRIQELREAIQRHFEALLDQARRDGTELPFDPNLPQMNARDLDRMAQQLQRSLDEGRTEDARRQMAELERLLEELQNARPEHGESRDQRNAERRQRGRQQTDAVQDMVQREGQLLDRSQQRSTAPAPPPSPFPPFPPQPRPQAQSQPTLPGQQPQSGQQAQSGQQRGTDARAQRAMRRALGELMQRFGDLTGQVPAPLSEADQAMRDAAQALADGRDAAAGSAEQRAIEALQKGGREMGQQIARQFGTGQQEGEDGDGQDGQDGQSGQGYDATQNRDGQTSGPQPGDQSSPGHRRSARRDPLGRPLHQGTSGAEDSGDVRVPDTMEQARTREIQEELRRRGAERTRPQPELDYIDRLLKPD